MSGIYNERRAVVLDSLRTINEVAQTLRISYRSVGRLIDRGELAFVKVGGRSFVEESELAAFIARNRKRRGVA